MDFIRRKYLIYTINNDVDFFKQELLDKISNFSLNHVLAISYIIKQYRSAVFSKDVFNNTNFYIYLHFVRDCEVYDIVLKASFDVTLLYLKYLMKNYTTFTEYIDAYKLKANCVLEDNKFKFLASNSRYFNDIIGINFSVEINPLFYFGKPVTDSEVIYSKLFKETTFKKVNKLEVLRLLVWMYSLKSDTGLEFKDNDNQSLYDVLQTSGPIVNSETTENFKKAIFNRSDFSATSYWLFLTQKTYDDEKVYYENQNAKTLYDKLLSYIYTELKQGRVNKNMLKLIYIFDDNKEIKNIMLELIYNIPGDILSLVDEKDGAWKAYFISVYKSKFIDKFTFTNPNRFYKDLFRVASALDPETFVTFRDISSIFTTDASTVERFSDIKINNTYVSQMVYQTENVDLQASENTKMCQIYNDNTKHYIKEYNTYLYFNEDDPTVIYKGLFVKLSSLGELSFILATELFSINILKYYFDSKLASIGLIVHNYEDDIILKIVTSSNCLEDFTSFVTYATCHDTTVLKSVIRNIINNFNVSVILLFKHFLKEHVYYVNEYLSNNNYLSKNEKKYILQIISEKT